MVDRGSLSDYLPVYDENVERDELIETYFHLGLKYKEILLFLLDVHGVEISIRQLKRILKRGLGRRRNPSEDADEAM